jgi:hypothetical protein
MQKNLCFQKKILFPISSILLLLFTILLVSSCNNGDKKVSESTQVTEAGVASSDFKMNCVILTKAQVQQWVDSGWTKPSNSARIRTLLFQFYTGDIYTAGSNMQLITYPGQSMTDVKINGKAILGIDTTCVAKTLIGPVIFGNNEINIDDLKILNPDGTLNDFDYIRLVPAQAYPPYVNFTIQIVRLGVTETLEGGGGTWPCPPYCG